jgi:glutathione S-transferase
MLTLFHAPKSRSTRVVSLIEEMGIADRIEVRRVDIRRQDGSGAPDPANPHPEHKAPVLLHDGRIVTETGAIMLHLTALFPDTGLSPAMGTAEWGEYTAWLTWYHAVMEPVIIFAGAGLSHPWLTATYRSTAEVNARLRAALDRGPWLMGDRFTAADILVHSPYAWFPAATPDDPVIRDWVQRCIDRPARQRVMAADTAALAG